MVCINLFDKITGITGAPLTLKVKKLMHLPLYEMFNKHNNRPLQHTVRLKKYDIVTII